MEDITDPAAKDVEDKVIGRSNLSDSSLSSLANFVHEKIEEMKNLDNEGSQLPDIFVVDDYSRILDDRVKAFLVLKEKLLGKHRYISGKLNSQLCFRKGAKEHVKFWLKQVEDISGSAAKDVEDKVRSRSNLSDSLLASLANFVREKIEELKNLDTEGSQLPDILVIDDSSASLELQTSKLQETDAAKTKIMECMMRDEVTKLAV